MPSISVTHKKRGRPATGKNPPVNVRMPPDLADAISKFVADQDPQLPNTSEAIRAILRDWLIGHGYLDLPPEQEHAN